MNTTHDSDLMVVRRHIDAVEAGDPAAMAADYAEDAVLVRGDRTHEGRAAIQAYFAGVPTRLAGGRVVCGPPVRVDTHIRFDWHIIGGPAEGSAGTDRCTVTDGLISHQVVSLQKNDF